MKIRWFVALVMLALPACDTHDDALSTDAARTETTSEDVLNFSPQRKGLPVSESSAEADSTSLPRIVAFGDSLTAGHGVSPDDSYPAQLQQRLDEAGYRYRVINAGVSGETTAGGLRRVPWVLKSRPDIVIVELGANDGLRGLPLTETMSNLERIIRAFQAEGVHVVLAGMKIPPNYGMAYTRQFATMYETLAQKHHVTLIPFFLDGVAAHPELNQADGIHPTEEGYRIIVDNLLQVLEPLLH